MAVGPNKNKHFVKMREQLQHLEKNASLLKPADDLLLCFDAA